MLEVPEHPLLKLPLKNKTYADFLTPFVLYKNIGVDILEVRMNLHNFDVRTGYFSKTERFFDEIFV